MKPKEFADLTKTDMPALDIALIQQRILPLLIELWKVAREIEHEYGCPIWASNRGYLHKCDCYLGDALKALQEFKP